MFNVDEFKAITEQNRGFSKANKFLARIPLPQQLNQFSPIARELEFWCTTSSLPGVTMMTHSTLRYGYGAREKRPVAPTYQDINFIFYADSAQQNWKFFSAWMQLIHNSDLSNGIASGNQTSQPYELSYKYRYVSDINVQTYTLDGQQSISVILRDSYPIYLQEARLSWGDHSGIMLVPVLITFNDWYIEEQQSPIQLGGF